MSQGAAGALRKSNASAAQVTRARRTIEAMCMTKPLRGRKRAEAAGAKRAEAAGAETRGGEAADAGIEPDGKCAPRVRGAGGAAGKVTTGATPGVTPVDSRRGGSAYARTRTLRNSCMRSSAFSRLRSE